MMSISILLFEDSETTIYDMQDKLAFLGYQLLGVFKTAEQGLEALSHLTPDLILMDIHLAGEMNGITAAQIIKQRFGYPIVYITSEEEDELLKQAKLANPFAFLFKPVQQRELSLTIETALYRAKVEKELKDTKHHLGERVKELNCLYQLGEIIENPRNEMAEIFAKTVDLIPPSFQYPQFTASCITYHEEKYTTSNFQESEFLIFSPIKVNRIRVGELKVYYTDKNFPKEKNPFLKEEQKLIDSITERLGRVIERKHSEMILSEISYILNQSPVIIFLWQNKKGWPVEFVSDNVEILFEYSATEFLERKINYEKVIHPNDLARVQQEVKDFSQNRKQKEIIHRPYRIITKTGQIKWVDDRTYIRWNTQGEITHYQGTVLDITDRIHTQMALKESENKYKSIFNNAKDAMLIFDLQGTIVEANETAVKMYGYAYEELIGLSGKEIVNPDHFHLYEQFLELVPKLGELTVESVDRRKDGSSFNINVKGIYFEYGSVPHLLGIITDISEAKKAQKDLFMSEMKYTHLFKTIAQGVVYHNANGEIIAANPSAVEILGQSLKEMQGTTTHDNIWKTIREDGSPFPPDEHPAMIALQTGEKVQDVVMGVYNPKKDTICWIRINATPIFHNGEDNPYQVYASFDDITELKRIERALMDKTYELEQILEALPEALVYADNNRCIKKINQAFTKIYGFKAEDVLGKPTSIFYANQEEFKKQGELRYNTNARQTHNTYEIKYRKKNGDIFQSETIGTPICDADDQVIGFLGLVWDITKQKQIEQERREYIQELQLINDTAIQISRLDDIDQICDLIGRNIHQVNPNTFVTISLFEKSIDSIIVKSLFLPEGLSKKKEEQAITIFKADPRTISIKPSDIGEEMKFYTSRKLEKVEDGLFTLLVNKVPKSVCEQLEAFLEIDSIYTVGFALEDQPYGGITLCLPANEIVHHINAIETIASHASLLIRRLQIENDLLHINKQLKTMTDQAKEANQLKTEFLQTISHELRTPLNGILGFSTLLMDEKLESRQRDFVNYIKQSGDRLKTIVNNLLDISRLEKGLLAIHFKVFSLKQSLIPLLENQQRSALNKKLLFSWELQENIPATINSDQDRFLQIVEHLIMNAIRYTDQGRVDFKCFVQHGDLYCQVIDTGIGIADKDRYLIFEPFVQIDSSISRREGGSGLGLSICKKIAELLGGYILLESELGKGSVFSFILPLSKILTNGQKEELILESDDSILDIKQILLVDDDETSLVLMQRILEKNYKGILIYQAKDGLEALEILRINPIDLILMDMRMPVMDGFETTMKIKSDPKLQSIPIIAITAYASEEDKEKCFKVGCNDFISKPISYENLIDKIQRY